MGRSASAGVASDAAAPRALGRSSSACTDGGAPGGGGSGGGGAGRQLGSGQASMPAVTSVTNSSLVVGWLDGVCGKAAGMCAAGAYLHWCVSLRAACAPCETKDPLQSPEGWRPACAARRRFERYGCGKAVLEEAIARMEDVADAYRLACGVREWL